MDYRYYRGDGPRVSPKLRRYLRLLRPVGIVILIVGLILPFLTVIKLIPSSYFSNISIWVLMILGPVCYLVGLTFDTFIDRSQ
jgi:hypothetical protein